jgi:hypothetical protein
MTSFAKRGSTCKTEKPRTDFNRNRRQPDRLDTRCRPCARARVREWKVANPDRAKGHRKAYKQRVAARKRTGRVEGHAKAARRAEAVKAIRRGHYTRSVSSGSSHVFTYEDAIVTFSVRDVCS